MCDRCGDARCNDPDSKWCSDILLMRYRAEREGLRAFIANLFEATDWPEGGDLDGFQFQELATKHGILTPEERIAPCEGRESCWCSDYGGPGPTTCYRKAQWLIDAQSAIAQGETK